MMHRMSSAIMDIRVAITSPLVLALVARRDTAFGIINGLEDSELLVIAARQPGEFLLIAAALRNVVVGICDGHLQGIDPFISIYTALIASGPINQTR